MKRNLFIFVMMLMLCSLASSAYFYENFTNSVYNLDITYIAAPNEYVQSKVNQTSSITLQNVWYNVGKYNASDHNYFQNESDPAKFNTEVGLAISSKCRYNDYHCSLEPNMIITYLNQSINEDTDLLFHYYHTNNGEFVPFVVISSPTIQNNRVITFPMTDGTNFRIGDCTQGNTNLEEAGFTGTYGNYCITSYVNTVSANTKELVNITIGQLFKTALGLNNSNHTTISAFGILYSSYRDYLPEGLGSIDDIYIGNNYLGDISQSIPSPTISLVSSDVKGYEVNWTSSISSFNNSLTYLGYPILSAFKCHEDEFWEYGSNEFGLSPSFYCYYLDSGTYKSTMEISIFNGSEVIVLDTQSQSVTIPESISSDKLVFLNETFGNSVFNYYNDTCAIGYSTSELTSATAMPFDNDWYCYMQDTSGFNDWAFVSETNLSKIKTSRGGESVLSSLVNSSATLMTNFSTINMDNTDVISFTCQQPTSNDNANFFVLSTSGILGDNRVAFSLHNGGCSYLEYIYGATSIPCCEISDVTGYDCGGYDPTNTAPTTWYEGGKIHQNFTELQAVTNCNNIDIGDLNFQSLERLDIWTTHQNGANNYNYFIIDDILIYRPNYLFNQSMPTILYLNPSPDPANISQLVGWGTSIGTDEPGTSIWTAFDCENDSVIDYPLAKRGVTMTFNCTYNSIGNYTGKVYATDDLYLNTSNVTFTAIVQVENATQVTPPQGGNCTGYVTQSCTGTCIFVDSFNYSKPISCAGWSGAIEDTNPINNTLQVFGMDVYHQDFELDKGTNHSIKANQYNSFRTSFDFQLNSADMVGFTIYNDAITQQLMYVTFDNYIITAYDGTPTPYSAIVSNVTPKSWHNFKMDVNYTTGKITYFLDNAKKFDMDFYDVGATSARKWVITWGDLGANFTIDNFQVNYLEANVNYTNTSTTTTVNYVFDPQYFCAIDWHNNSTYNYTDSTTHKFSMDNCAARGYDTQSALIALCVPRACLQDTGLMIVAWATSNIFVTIIVVAAFILIAPLIVSLLPRR